MLDDQGGHLMQPLPIPAPAGFGVSGHVHPILSICDIHKRFGGTYALRDVSFSVGQGQVLALLGENGAGKSTLIKILAGVHELDRGKIIFAGADATRSLAKLPLAFIHQDLGLIEWMTVAENVCLTRGFERRAGLISWKRCRQRAHETLRGVGLHIDPDVRVRSLTQTERSLVAIARAITTSAKVIVMDEPTASLPADDVERLFDAVRSLRNNGVAVIYVSHRLEEVFSLADRVVVLRDGCLVADQTTRSTSRDELVRLIVGSAVKPTKRTEVERTPRRTWEVSGGVAGAVGPVSFFVRPGEILGLTGLRGAGQERIGRAIFGLIPFERGRCFLDGKELGPLAPSRAIIKGLRFASGDRHSESTVSGFTIAENFFLNPCAAGKSVFSPIHPGAERKAAARLGGFVRLRPNDPKVRIDDLSGGNQQKVVLGRWLNLPGKLLILEEPTAGVDVGAKSEIYQLLFDAVKVGLSIIIVSTDFVELATICHRAIVFSHNRIVREIAAKHLTAEALLSAAAVDEIGRDNKSNREL